MKLYTEEEVRKMHRSFRKILAENKISACNIHGQLYFPTPIEVELTGRITGIAAPESISYECNK